MIGDEVWKPARVASRRAALMMHPPCVRGCVLGWGWAVLGHILPCTILLGATCTYHPGAPCAICTSGASPIFEAQCFIAQRRRCQTGAVQFHWESCAPSILCIPGPCVLRDIPAHPQCTSPPKGGAGLALLPLSRDQFSRPWSLDPPFFHPVVGYFDVVRGLLRCSGFCRVLAIVLSQARV